MSERSRDYGELMQLAQLCSPHNHEQSSLYKQRESLGLSRDSLTVETEFAMVCLEMVQNGLQFDIQNAHPLLAWLDKEVAAIRESFLKKYGVDLGALMFRNDELGAKIEEFTKLQLPRTADGNRATNKSVLSKIDHLTAQKTILYRELVAAGTALKSLIKFCSDEGRIHAPLHPHFAVGGRTTYSLPCVSSISKQSTGKKIRNLFCAERGKIFLSMDAKEMETRLLAHFLHPFSKEFAQIVTQQDFHTRNAQIMNSSRGEAKGFFYALLYGAGSQLLADILGVTTAKANDYKRAIKGNIPGLAEKEAVLYKEAQRGFIQGIDGRRLCVETHAILNLLLQSGTAFLMKRFTVIFSDELKKFAPNSDAFFRFFLHDEVIIELREACTINAIRAAKSTIDEINQTLNCPMDLSFRRGHSWGELEDINGNI